MACGARPDFILPVSAVVVTRNEAGRIGRCLDALQNFSEIIVVDSESDDGTPDIAAAGGARAVNFRWNRRYPKKRQWCLDNIDFAQDWVFFVDADEIMTMDLCREMQQTIQSGNSFAGYFVRGRYVWNGKVLRHGLHNNKLALLNRRYFEFPAVDDLDIPGMGEIEGHYQPVLKSPYRGRTLGQLKSPLLHDACGDRAVWEVRHRRYAVWEAEMTRRNLWPEDPARGRRLLKKIFRVIPFRPEAAFLHSYILKRGFLDGAAGFDFARARRRYYRMIRADIRRAGASTGGGQAF